MRPLLLFSGWGQRMGIQRIFAEQALHCAQIVRACLGLAHPLEEILGLSEAAAQIIPQLAHPVDGVEITAQAAAVGLKQSVVELPQFLTACRRAAADPPQQRRIGR